MINGNFGAVKDAITPNNSILNTKIALLIAEAGQLNGINGFEFDVATDTSSNSSATITQQPVESGSYIGQHIRHQPKTLSLKGFIGTKVFKAPSPIEEAILFNANKLDQLANEFVDKYTPQQVQDIKRYINPYNTAAKVEAEVEKVKNLAQLIETFMGSHPFKKAYEKLETFKIQNTPCSVKTGWFYYTNMYITNVSVTQNQNEIIDISVDLEEVIIVDTESYMFYNGIINQGDIQNAESINLGEVKTEPKASIIWQGVNLGVETTLPF